jgi:Na+/alanine symporter
MRFLTNREDLYDVTDFSLVSIRFQSRVFRLYSTDGISSRHYVSYKFFHFFYALVVMNLVMLAGFIAQISTSFSILVPRMCVLYHNFFLHIFLLSPDELPWFRVIK